MNAANTIDATGQKKKKRSVTLLGVLVAFVILYTVMPIVARFVSDYLSTYLYMVLVVLLFAVVLLLNGLDGLLEHLFLMAPLILYEALTFFANSDSLVMWGYGVLVAMLPMLLGLYATKKMQRSFPLFLGVLLFALLVTTATTSFGLLRYPQAARVLATIESSDSPMLRTFNYANIGGYDFVYIVVLLYPCLILAYKKKKVGRLVTILGVVLAFTLAILSEYTTAFLFLILSSLFFFFKKDLTVKRILLFGFLGLIAIFLLGMLFSGFFSWLADVVNSEIMAERLRDLAGGWSGLSNSEDARLPLYLRSLSAFAQKPLLGHFLSPNGFRVGGHSFLLDSLGTFGLVGALLLFFLYRRIYRTFFRPYQKEATYGYVFWIFLQTLLLSLLNTGMWLWVLCFFAPVVLHQIYKPSAEEAPAAAPAPSGDAALDPSTHGAGKELPS